MLPLYTYRCCTVWIHNFTIHSSCKSANQLSQTQSILYLSLQLPIFCTIIITVQPYSHDACKRSHLTITPHYELPTVTGLGIRVRLEQALPLRFRLECERHAYIALLVRWAKETGWGWLQKWESHGRSLAERDVGDMQVRIYIHTVHSYIGY